MRIRANYSWARAAAWSLRFTKAVFHAVFLVAVSWNLQAAAQPLDLGRSSVTQAEEPLIHTPDAHGQDPLGADSAWFWEFKRDVSNDSADPHSDQMLDRLRKAKGTIDAQWSGPWTPTINEAHRTVTAQRSFNEPGVYSIRPYAEWNVGFGPYRVTVGTPR